MCGRFTLTPELPFVEEHFRPVKIEAHLAATYRPRYNIAPGQNVLTVVAERDNGAAQRAAEYRRWGLIPAWAKDPAVGYRMINARSETVAERPAFRSAFRRRRCLVPADGFYEWRAVGRRKLPFRFRLRSGGLFALAGLWEEWQPPGGGDPILSCTVLTTKANDVVAPIHHRMPVIVHPDDYSTWLDPDADPSDLTPIMFPYPDEEMEAYPVSPEVNSARNDDPDLIKPAPSEHGLETDRETAAPKPGQRRLPGLADGGQPEPGGSEPKNPE